MNLPGILIYLLCTISFGAVVAIEHSVGGHPFLKSDYRKLLLGCAIWPITLAIVVVDTIESAFEKLLKYQRFKAVACAFYYAIIPWQWYEEKKHYKGSYFRHMISNLKYAFKWLFFQEDEVDLKYEREVNKNY